MRGRFVELGRRDRARDTRRRVDLDVPRPLRADPARPRGSRRPRPRVHGAGGGRGARPARQRLRARARRLPRRRARRGARPRRGLRRRRAAAADRDRPRPAAQRGADAPAAAGRRTVAEPDARGAGAPRWSAPTPSSRPTTSAAASSAPAPRCRAAASAARGAGRRRAARAAALDGAGVQAGQHQGLAGRRLRGLPARRWTPSRGAWRDAPRRGRRRAARRAAGALRRRLRGGQAGARGAGLRRPRAARPRPAARHAGDPRALRRALRARHGRRVPGHQRHAARACWSCWARDRFVVGDELQSIYSFRHADVRIFRASAPALAPRGAAAELAANFRSRPEILGVLDAAIGPLHGAAHVPFVAGARGRRPARRAARRAAADRRRGGRGVAAGAARRRCPRPPAKRRAEARVVAAAHRRAGRATRACRPPTSWCCCAPRPTWPSSSARSRSRGCRRSPPAAAATGARQQVLDLCAYLGALANPRDELALFGLFASPLVGAVADGLASCARGAPGARWDALRRRSGGAAAERRRRLRDLLPDADRDALAEFLPVVRGRARARRRGAGWTCCCERVVDRTGYDLHVLGLPGGRAALGQRPQAAAAGGGLRGRRGRDVRGLIDLATAELEAEARETDAPVELGDATAIRLMTMHAAKGLEFPVVVVADLGRPGRNDTDDLLVREGRVGLRLRTIDGASAKTLDWEALRDEQQTADLEEERRILHVAMTRAEERLILSGTFDPDKWLGAPQPAVAPLRWLAPRLVTGLEGLARRGPRGNADARRSRSRRGPRERVAVRVHREPPRAAARAPRADRGGGRRPGRARAGRRGARRPARPRPLRHARAAAPARLREPRPGWACRARSRRVSQAHPRQRRPPRLRRASPRARGRLPRIATPPRPLPATLSYTSLAAYDRCAYRWYLERILRLPRDESGGPAMARAERPAGPIPDGLDALTRGSLAHVLLEELDFAAPIGADRRRRPRGRAADGGRADRRRRRRSPGARRRVRRRPARGAPRQRDRRPPRARLRRRPRRRQRAAAQRRHRRARLRGRRRRARRRLQVRRRRARRRPRGARRGRLRRPAAHLRARGAGRGRRRRRGRPPLPRPPGRAGHRRL